MSVTVNNIPVDTKTETMRNVHKKYFELTDAIMKCEGGPSQHLCIISIIVRLADGISQNKTGALEVLDAAAGVINNEDFEKKDIPKEDKCQTKKE